MQQQQFELCCRDIQALCSFGSTAESRDELLQTIARHARDEHGMRQFPTTWWAQMRQLTRTLPDGQVALSCGDIQQTCDFLLHCPSLEELQEAYAEHAKTRHGIHAITPEMWSLIVHRVNT